MADGSINRLSFMRAKAHEATPLLRFLAGPHADAIASVWSAPHRDFFALPAARRHAAAILLDHGERDLAHLAFAVERHKDREIAERLAYSSEIGGLMKALSRMGETLWRADQYRCFLRLFASNQANRLLRHMPRLEPEQLALVDTLSAELHEAGILAKVPGLEAARDLAMALDMACILHGTPAVRALVAALAKAKDPAALFGKAADALSPDAFSRPSPPPELALPFVAVRSARELEAVALRFRNCLRDFRGDMIVGRMAVYVWEQSQPVVLALRWDPVGWRLAEAELAGNEDAPEDALHQIVEALARADVRTDPSTFALANRLRRHPYGERREVGESWRERLELGEMWD